MSIYELVNVKVRVTTIHADKDKMKMLCFLNLWYRILVQIVNRIWRTMHFRLHYGCTNFEKDNDDLSLKFYLAPLELSNCA